MSKNNLISMFIIIIGILAIASPVQGFMQSFGKPSIPVLEVPKPSTEDLIKAKEKEAEKSKLLSEKANKEREALEVQKKLDELEAPKKEETEKKE